MSARFSYVILQYGGFSLTQACIEAILQVDTTAAIVVVDNCSPDDSFMRAKRYAASSSNVHVLEVATNSGFSHGNNVGYEFAAQRLAPDYIVVLNNDVIIEQLNFTAEVERIFSETRFAVLGPDIYVPAAKRHQNPFHIMNDTLHPDSPSVADIEDAERAVALRLEQIEAKPGVKQQVKRVLLKTAPGKALIARRAERRSQQHETEFLRRWNERMEDVPLQGACYIFSHLFTEKMEQPFYPETFLYCEEMLLQLNCRHRGLKMVYDPALRVIHNEGSTRAAQFDEEQLAKREQFTYENIQTSLRIVRQHIIDLGEAAE